MKTGVADLLLRAAVGVAFLYPPINAWSAPEAWTGYFPAFTEGLLPGMILLHVFGVVEIVLALWILSGWKIFFPSLVAALMLIAIVGFNMPEMQVLFRDISIALAALALAFMHKPVTKITQ